MRTGANAIGMRFRFTPRAAYQGAEEGGALIPQAEKLARLKIAPQDLISAVDILPDFFVGPIPFTTWMHPCPSATLSPPVCLVRPAGVAKPFA